MPGPGNADHEGLGREFEPLVTALARHSEQIGNARRVWVAFSGGADSTALLLALVRSRLTRKLRATHINHGVQVASGAWAQSCLRLCNALAVPLDIATITPPKDGRFRHGLEAWAREARYRHWRQLLGPHDLLVLGHHAGDQQETVALRLLQGRLPLPMPARRSLSDTGASLLRPWLSLPAAVLREVLIATGQSWVDDPSNFSTTLLRNHVRQVLLPSLAAETPDGAKAWQRALERCGDLTQRLVACCNALTEQKQPQAGEMLRLPLIALRCPASVQAILKSLGVSVTQLQVEDALSRLRAQAATQRGQADRQGIAVSGSGAQNRTGRSADFSAGEVSLWLAREGVADDGLVFWRSIPLESRLLRLPTAGRLELQLDHGRLTIEGPAGLELWLRCARRGDRVEVAGRARPLREWLRAQGVPRWARSSYPLLQTSAPGVGAAGGAGQPVEDLNESALVVPEMARTPSAGAGAGADDTSGARPCVAVSRREPQGLVVPLRAWFSAN